MNNNTSLTVNAELSDIFRHMADCYRYKGGNDRFRANAYENASRTLNNLGESVIEYGNDLKKLEDLNGIGESIGEKIIEYIKTGSIKTYERLKKEVPGELLELMNIENIGPATVRILHEKMNIDNKDDLIKALKENKLKEVKGFGEKKIANLMSVLKIKKTNKRMSLPYAIQIADEILKEIRGIKGVHKAELAGSLRRKKETIGDIDIIILAKPKDRKKIVSRIIALSQVQKILAKGITKVSVVLNNNVQIDVRLVNDHEYGAAMLYFTGSREHTIKLRTIAKEKGYKINEYGLFDVKTNKRLAGETEEGMYKVLRLKYIPPEQRIGENEIEKAAK